MLMNRAKNPRQSCLVARVPPSYSTMASYLIGDIHGCSRTLQRLVAKLDARPGRDRLLLTGDLVNRGPDSLGVVRWAMQQGPDLTCVLGNHDLQLLGAGWRVPGFSRPNALSAVLDAPDRAEILEWMRARPLLVHDRESGCLLVHAGLLPAWTASFALERATTCATTLKGPDAASLLALTKDDSPQPGSDPSPELRAQASFLRIATHLRLVNAAGEMVESFTGSPSEKPSGTRAWFLAKERRTSGQRVLFGHWARLGLMLREDAWCLDSGCVWGESLSAVCLENGSVVQESYAEEPPRA